MAINVNWSDLTTKEKNLIGGYTRHGNKTRAYREAYDTKITDSGKLNRAAQKIFKKPKIKAIVDQIQEQAVIAANLEFEEISKDAMQKLVDDKVGRQLATIDAAWVLRRAALLADFNIRQFIKVDGQGNAVYDFSEADDDDWYCISEYTVEEINKGQGDDTYFVDKIKVKTVDKLRALEIVGKHVQVQAFKESVDVNHKGTIKHSLNDFYDDAATPESEDADSPDEEQ